ncbi:MAG TPA: hypothetical protein PK771_12610, partial [Spirochaetota bacterium]|nr:hypothetical protein [Spirochaetota bacterium]
SILILFIIMLVASIFSYGFFHYDEHYQIVEYVGLKLGKSTQSDMTWEYGAKIRPWLQPGFYYIIAKGLTFFGVENPFYLVFAFRFVTGLFGILAILLLILLSNFYFKDDTDKKKSIVYIFLFLFFIPYFIVRTSSESLSGSFFIIGFALLFLFSKKVSKYIETPNLIAFVTGLLFGLSFQFRYQIAFMIIGFGLWFLIFSSSNYLKNFLKILLMLVGFLITLAIGVLVDYWGYGEWGLSFWNYFYRNLVEKASENWGVDPFWGYLYLVNMNIFVPLTIFIMVSFFIYWIRYPKSIITFITVIFFLGHSAVAHKEARFLFPMIFFVPFVIVEAFSRKGDRLDFFGKIYEMRKTIIAKLFYILNFIYLIFLIFFDMRFDLPIQKEVIKSKIGTTLYCLENANPYDNYGAKMNFYKPKDLNILSVTKSDIDNLLIENKKIYVVSDGIKNPIKDNEIYKVTIKYKKFPDFITENYFVRKVINFPRIKNQLRYYVLYQLEKK